ncbi:MAG: hypothetical protein IT214_12615 [Chitinophagaceae bacterium]|nr:hypothetical protein [Chitinophagaceae bacterium]
MKAWPIITVSFLLISGKLQAQSSGNNIVLYSITETNGLSDDHVQCVVKDKKGFIWIGTSDGLNLMDGSTITVFRHHNADSTSLVSDDINCLSEDSSGNILIGTQQGLSVLPQNKRSFFSVSLPEGLYGDANSINTIVVDKENRVWCSTKSGLFLYNEKDHSFRPFYITSKEGNNNISLSNRLTCIISDRSENKLWMSTADGLWSFDLDNFSFKKEISALNEKNYKELYTCVFQSHDGKIWAGSWGNGLEQFDKLTGKVIHYSFLPEFPEVVRYIREAQQPDGKQVLWLDGHLSAFDPAAQQFFHFSMKSQSGSIPDLLPCFRSDDGWLWLASSSGLYIYNPDRQFFQHHFFHENITSQNVVFAEWKHSLLVGGGPGNFLKLYDDHWKMIKDFGSLCNLAAAKGTTGSDPILLSLLIQNNTNFWMGTSEGFAKFNTEKDHTDWYFHNKDDSTTLPRNFITNFFRASDNRFWIFPWREGIWSFDTATGKFKKIWDHFLTIAGKPKKLVIANAAEDKRGNIWFADLDEGIILYNKKSGTFSKPFIKQIGEMESAGSVFYKNGFLYSSVPTAILKWDETDRKLKIIELPPEMNKQIYSLCPDSTGNWWILTKNGLVVYNETAGSFRRFTTADGLINNDMSGTLFCRSDGTMVYGNNDYITTFNPGKFLTAIAKVPAVQLREILSNETPVPWDGKNTLRFNSHIRNIIFRWALPDFSGPLHNEYFCKLQGIDSGWRYIGNSGEVQYANLSPGEYSVQLKAASANGVFSSDIITIPFEILAPFWKTSWFITLVFLSIVSVSGLVARYISHRNLKEKLLELEKVQAVEKERNRISRDMHDDLGSGLTKIAIMSEVVKKQINDPEKAKQQLENISESSRELVDNLQDIIWILNPKNDTLESLASYIREYALKFFEPFKVETQFVFPEKFPLIRLSEETRRNIFLTVKESFNNIGKHAWCDTVNLAIGITDNCIELTIKDDGKGFDVNHTREFGNGLSNMKNRIQQIGGEYEIMSVPGNGTETKIRMPV